MLLKLSFHFAAIQRVSYFQIEPCTFLILQVFRLKGTGDAVYLPKETFEEIVSRATEADESVICEPCVELGAEGIDYLVCALVCDYYVRRGPLFSSRVPRSFVFFPRALLGE